MLERYLENLKNNNWLVDITTYNRGCSQNIPVVRYTIHKSTIQLISFVNKRELIYLYPAKNSIIKLEPITTQMIEDVEKAIKDARIEREKRNQKT